MRFLLVLLFAQNVWAAPLFVDLKDLAVWNSTEVPHAAMILGDIKKNPEKYFQTNPAEVFGIELYQQPYGENGAWVYPIRAMVTFDKKTVYFRKLEVLATTKVESVRALDEVSLDATEFAAEVSNINRTLLLTDKRFGIKKLFPLGVGGVDAITRPGKIKFLTPLIEQGALKKKYVIAKRIKPAYYLGKPFIRISEKNGKGTAYGFHIQQNKIFVRGFDSHGCIRLRDKDLKEFFQIVTQGPRTEISLNITNFISETEEHPYPKFTEYYKAFKNFGTKTNPKIKRDEWGLVIMEKIAGIPPIEQIVNGGVSNYLP